MKGNGIYLYGLSYGQRKKLLDRDCNNFLCTRANRFVGKVQSPVTRQVYTAIQYMVEGIDKEEREAVISAKEDCIINPSHENLTRYGNACNALLGKAVPTRLLKDRCEER